MINVIKFVLSTILLALSLIVTYSTVVVSGFFLAIGTCVNYPILYTLGRINGREKIIRIYKQTL